MTKVIPTPFTQSALPQADREAVRQSTHCAPAQESVVIIEPNFTGHRWRYAQWAADAFTEAGYRCLIVTESRNEDHRLARKIVAAGRPDLEIAFVDPPEARSASLSVLGRISYFRYHRYFRYAYQLVSEFQQPALIVVPYVDYFLYALPFLGSPFQGTPWIGITMRATFHHRKVGVKAPDRRIVNAVKSLLFGRAVRVRGMRALLSIDPTLPEWSARALGQRAAAIRYLADPFPNAHADDPARARERLGLSLGRHLLVYGAITERKGIRELVTTLEQMGSKAPTLVVAGEQDAATREFLGVHASRLQPAPVLLDLFVTNEMELDLFSACDAVWLGYKGHYGMSGVLVQAYRFNKPVIATADGLIGWFCRSGELGPVIDDLSTDAIGRAIDAVFDAKHPVLVKPVPTQNERHERLLERNTLEQFKRTLQEAMG
ncbi:MAG TPA: group 1 glycosyl transferase [Trinickia sp.]|uniref:group 1 glycosyl transferase n=1 Tax=Trinickia sp. TaxID=2571163 RepID=UPI002C4FF201|nr:group 1 glycosyl transferase [Trinickia sp.]HTI19146.1 group 1 glycosyl transferase [Trinickia sp.]